ncbi:MAG: thiamine pyrophosphate-binding protein [Chloroflexi bacterium]|nr:thiamine pyrophosphate-binding protein [Chloroflexota bacterium]
MATMTGGQAVVEALRAEGVRTVFGIPGLHTLHIYEALRTCPTIRHITTRHEQGAAFMADGYARATGEPGVCLTITGPGATNTLTALGNAYSDSSPVLCISSEVATGFIGQDKEVFHEIKDQLGLFAGVTAWNERVASVAEIPGAVQRAMRSLRTGRPRPAHLDVPIDLLAATGEVEIAPLEPVERPAADPKQVCAAAALLAGARAPLIYAGGGAVLSGASAALVSLAERLGAPVVSDYMGKGAFPEDHPLSLGCGPWRRGLIADYLARADLLLVVGARLGQIETRDWTLPLPKTLVHVDIDPTVIGRHYPATVGVVGDARQALEQIAEALKGMALHPGPSPAMEIARWQAAERAQLQGEPGFDFMMAMQAVLARDAIVVNDAALVNAWTARYLPTCTPRSFLFPNGFAALGFGLPAALGAKVACPERQVVVVCGDGGFLFTAQELATAVQYGLNVVVMIFNDNSYGSIARLQRTYFGPTFAADLVNPDFVRLAEAFGAWATRASTPEEVGAALAAALRANRPALIEVPVRLEPPS